MGNYMPKWARKLQTGGAADEGPDIEHEVDLAYQAGSKSPLNVNRNPINPQPTPADRLLSEGRRRLQDEHGEYSNWKGQRVPINQHGASGSYKRGGKAK